MPKKGQTHPISEDDRLRYKASFDRMKREDPSLTMESAGRHVGLKKSQISKILSGKQKQSVQKPQLDKFFGGPTIEAPLIKAIIAVAIKLDPLRQNKLHERALALLDEQKNAN